MPPKKFKIVLNDRTSLNDLLNSLYNEANTIIVQSENEINKITSSTNLVDMEIESKEKYSKAVNGFIANKTNAMKFKLDIGKILSEILKFGGDENNALNSLKKQQSELTTFDIKNLQKQLLENNKQEEAKVYQVK